MVKNKTIFLVVLFASLFITVHLVAAAPVPVTGWAWIGADNCDGTGGCISQTNPLGWVSFISYGVNIDYATDEISGYAWVGDDTTGVAWLDFSSNALSGYGPTGVDAFAARLDSATNKIIGWAPIVANTTIISWVHFCSSCGYSAVINTDGTIGAAGSANHYAWAGSSSDADFTGLGWIDLRQVKFSLPPPVVSSLSENFLYNTNGRQMRFNWTMTGGTLPQNGFQIQVRNAALVTIFDSCVIPYDTCNAGGSAATYTIPANILNYSTNYDWRIQVKDSGSPAQLSRFTDWKPFTTGSHSFSVDFSYSPSPQPSKGENVMFTQTVSFVNITPALVNPYSWTFTNATPETASGSSVITIFNSSGSQTATLTATDSDGHTFSLSREITVNLALPKFKEIIPR